MLLLHGNQLYETSLNYYKLYIIIHPIIFLNEREQFNKMTHLSAREEIYITMSSLT